jgi:hypothetical protein
MTVPPDDDEVFRQIVADFEKGASGPVPGWPVSEDLSDDAPAADDEPPPDVPVLSGDLPSWLEPDALPDDGHYVPPPPPRLPRPRPRTVGALLMMLAGFAVLFVPFRVGLDDSPISLILGMLLAGGGTALLVAWMRDAPGRPDDPDDGAVV